jgi:phosphate transport system substrate-binding protein
LGVRFLTFCVVAFYAAAALLAGFDYLRRQNRRGTPGRETLVLAGSTSVQPFAEKMAETFMREHPGCEIAVQGGGSTAGIQAVRSGVAAVGMSSRNLKDDEKTLTSFVVARDAIAVIVHPGNPVSSLRIDQIRGIFAGRIARWDEVGGLPEPIVRVSREEGSGTQGAFREMVMGKEKTDSRSLVQDSNGAVRETVASNRRMIGYVSMQFLSQDDRVKGVAVDGVAPDVGNAKSGRYRLIRNFLFVTDGPPKGLAVPFFDFVRGSEGREILEAEGLIAVR